MNGLIHDLFSGPISYSMLSAHICFLILDMIFYYVLCKIFKITGFNDRIVFYHQLPLVVLMILSLIIPVVGYFICLHLIAHFLAETIFLCFCKQFGFIVHHVYTIIYQGTIVLCCPPIYGFLAGIPMLNNTLYHMAKTYGILEQTRMFRQIYFILCRILFPVIILVYVIGWSDFSFRLKMGIGFFAVSIVLLMLPKLRHANFNSQFNHNMPDSVNEMSKRVTGGFKGIYDTVSRVFKK